MRHGRLLPLMAFLAVSAVTAVALAEPTNEFTAALARGPLYAGVAAFLSGLLVSLTPCVYPMVAVTVSVFGGREVKSRWGGAALSGAFVLGIVAMFVPLGVVAGMTGSLAGSVLQSRWVVIGISMLFVAMAASLFGAFELDLPSGIKNRLAQAGGTGYLGAFLLGVACGPIAAPCTGPFLTGILAWIAQTQSAFLGAAAMAAFALGLGVPFFVVGAFAIQLPKSGAWMVHVKSVLGIVMLVVALYFLSTAFPALTAPARPSAPFITAMIIVMIGGLLVGAVHKQIDGPGADRLRKVVGIIVTAGAAFLLVAGAAKPESSLEWAEMSAQEARARALDVSRPLIVDFTASWCAACKELDKLTFAESSVQREAGRFIAVKVDATNDDDPVVERTLEEFEVIGLPTVLIFDSRGQETVRYTDFVGPQQFLEALQSVD